MPASFESSQPLARRRILVTRAPHQASELAELLRRHGAIPLLVPTIEIGPPDSYARLDDALRRLSTFDQVAFTSANAVEGFRVRAEALGIRPVLRHVAAVGRATERALQTAGLRADVLPPVFTAESLAQTLAPEARGKRFLLVLAEGAPTTLCDNLVASGAAQVVVVPAYSNRVPHYSVREIAALFRNAGSYPDAVTFTSASSANNLVALLDSAQLELPDVVVRASIGPMTSQALQRLNLPPHIEAKESSIPALVACLEAFFQGG